MSRIRSAIRDFDYKSLFIEELGWDRFNATPATVTVGAESFTLRPVAQKHGVAVFVCDPNAQGGIPDYATRKRIDAEERKLHHEHVIIYEDADKTRQIWQWVKHQSGRAVANREATYHRGQSGEPLAQRLAQLFVDLLEDDSLTIAEVAERARNAFDVDKVTKKFYDRFQAEHKRFVEAISGIGDEDMRRWYASLMLNRLMFSYFIQSKRFLDNDPNYLRNRMKQMQARFGADQFHTFYREFLLRFFHDGLGTPPEGRSPEVAALIGTIPYLNGGLFEVHQIESSNRAIAIPDAAFERIFDFFDDYNWHLDDRPMRDDKEINPDVLGYIFEKFINQKQMGAYYTKEDITGYIGRNTILPFLFESARKDCAIAFAPEGEVWRLLRDDPDRYIYEAVRKGVDIELPAEIAAGIGDVARRGGWNRPAGEEYALPTETWREHVARRTRCLELRARLASGEMHKINDLITWNLDIVQFAQDVIERCEGPDLLRAFWKALKQVSVLDPTCGSGAFLFAALRLLEPLYEACLLRMRSFVQDFDREGRSRLGPDFRDDLARVDAHHSQSYFIRKEIILNNLYGVDIMEEAVEIAKLRLFLSLVSRVDHVRNLEPLPDIDFNIRAGNTLVGFATYAEAEAAVSGNIIWYQQMPQIRQQAEELSSLFARFREQQTTHGGQVTKQDKQALRGRLSTLGDTLDRFLAADYGIDESHYPAPASYEAALAVWRKSHQPFHWFVEFYAIVHEHGGFDVIIGNPPWKEYSAVRKLYTVQGYKTEVCGNLYGLCTERILNLRAHGQTPEARDTNPNRANIGWASFIVQLPLVNSSRMISVRNMLRESSSGLWVIPFDDRPGKLFEGLQHCRSTIFVSLARDIRLAASQPAKVHTAKYQRWPTETRDTLIPQVEPVYCGDEPIYPTQFPKYATQLVQSLFAKVAGCTQQRLGITLSQHSTSHFVFYQEAMQYWAKACIGLPYYAKNKQVGAPDHGRYLHVTNANHASALSAVLNSSLFYLYFIAYGDCFHLSDTLVAGFPASQAILDDSRLSSLGIRLMERLKASAERKTINTKDGDEITYDEYYGAAAKPIIDEIDRVLARHYSFSDEELDFIINYDIKYRMGADNGENGDGGGEE